MLLEPGLRPPTEAMFTMRPPSPAARCGASARLSRNGPRRLVSSTRSQVPASSWSSWRNGMPMFQAALLTRMSHRAEVLDHRRGGGVDGCLVALVEGDGIERGGPAR